MSVRRKILYFTPSLFTNGFNSTLYSINLLYTRPEGGVDNYILSHIVYNQNHKAATLCSDRKKPLRQGVSICYCCFRLFFLLEIIAKCKNYYKPKNTNYMPDTYLRSVISGKSHPSYLSLPPQFSSAINLLTPIIRQWAGTQLVSIFPSGSYSKNTAILGSSDVDLFISLKSDTTTSLKDIYHGLDSKMRANNYQTRLQNVSIRVTSGTCTIDLVPGVKQSGLTSDHSLYRRKADSWTKTNIQKHINLVKTSGRTDEIKAIKIWRDLHDLEFPSFYLEMVVIEALKGYSFNSPARNILRVLDYLANDFYVARFVDPSNTNNIVSDDLTAVEKQTIVRQANASRQKTSWGEIIW